MMTIAKDKHPMAAWLPLLLALLLTAPRYAHAQESDQTEPQPRTLQNSIDSLLRGKPATFGVAISYNGNTLCRVRADQPFPMMSVYKLHQAVAIADSIGRLPKGLSTPVLVTKDMLSEGTHSPLRDRFPDGNTLVTVEKLLHYSLNQSDNNACDILFERFGGTAYTQRRLQSLGLAHTQVKWTEGEMHEDPSRSYDNSTTPDDALRLLTLAYEDEWTRQTLKDCRTGARRIPALLPQGTVVGHKTGTGGPGADRLLHGINDLGFVALPDGTHFLIAIFCDNSQMSLPETECIISEIARIAYDYLLPKSNP